jgi:hypothetical protein
MINHLFQMGKIHNTHQVLQRPMKIRAGVKNKIFGDGDFVKPAAGRALDDIVLGPIQKKLLPK